MWPAIKTPGEFSVLFSLPADGVIRKNNENNNDKESKKEKIKEITLLIPKFFIQKGTKIRVTKMARIAEALRLSKKGARNPWRRLFFSGK